MSLQDDIFDVRDALKHRPEAKAFDRLMERMNHVEKEADVASDIISRLLIGIEALRTLGVKL